MSSQRAGCILIINKVDGTFLSVSNKKRTDFNLPGGKVEMNETFQQAAIREIKEETGLDIYNLTFLHKDIDMDYEVITYYTKDYQGSINTVENQ